MRALALVALTACTLDAAPPAQPSRFVVLLDRSDGFLDAQGQACAAELAPALFAILDDPRRTRHGDLVVYATGGKDDASRVPLGSWSLQHSVPNAQLLGASNPLEEARRIRSQNAMLVDAVVQACQELRPEAWSPLVDATRDAIADLRATCRPGQTCSLTVVTDGLETARPEICASIFPPGRASPCPRGAQPDALVPLELGAVDVRVCGLGAGTDATPRRLPDAVRANRDRVWSVLLGGVAGGVPLMPSCAALYTAPPALLPANGADTR